MNLSNCFAFLILLCFASPSSANLCLNIFSNRVKAPYNHVYAGQESVGKEYALYKALRDAGLNPRLQLEDLNRKEKKILMDSLLEDLSEPIPAVRDPSGRFFLLDGHHSLYMAVRLFQRVSDIPIELKLVYDAQLTGISWENFVNLSIKEHWFYIPTAASIIAKPLHIHELQNNVERSLLGLFFISVEEKYDVPMKGKHFQPFIQFYLADLIRENSITTLPPKVDLDDIASLRKTLLANPQVVHFLIAQLRPGAPAKLKDFLYNISARLNP